ncbi:hypothetical protein DM02DRAFT_608253 [Periconia macrospinosa]|uniref:Uncharacterized protein n=1 Tax=Periconia macrospinosa TaxID=97972 RepID=A0A2V1EC36_9PLEO|nr:hypothetical protein DM02DRAFT_608253 [Periconia macrospinosa]
MRWTGWMNSAMYGLVGVSLDAFLLPSPMGTWVGSTTGAATIPYCNLQQHIKTVK